MEEFEMLINYIWEELDDADKYARKAVHYKEINSGLSEMFLQLSKEEINHMERLRDHAVKCLEKYSNIEEVKEEQTIWKWEHRRIADCAIEIKRIQNMAK